MALAARPDPRRYCKADPQGKFRPDGILPDRFRHEVLMSKLSSWRVLTGAAVLAGLLGTGAGMAGTAFAQAVPAAAGTAGPLSIIVVDVTALMRDSKAARSIN